MSETEITIKVKIFDDPEYCLSENNNTICKWLDPENECMIFIDEETKIISLKDRETIGKCNQCKEALKQAKK